MLRETFLFVHTSLVGLGTYVYLHDYDDKQYIHVIYINVLYVIRA